MPFALREKKLKIDPLCERCLRKATQVHHKIALVCGGKDELDNLASLCDMCHREIEMNRFESFDSCLQTPPYAAFLLAISKGISLDKMVAAWRNEAKKMERK